MDRGQLIEAHDRGLWPDVINTGWWHGHLCMICRRPTPLIEINFEGPLCSDQCVNAMWADYMAALRS